MSDLLLTKEVAQILRVSKAYVRSLIKQGKLKAYKEASRGGYRVTKQDITKYINQKYDEILLKKDTPKTPPQLKNRIMLLHYHETNTTPADRCQPPMRGK